MKNTNHRFHVELALSTLESDIAAREVLVGNIGKLAPASPLFANPAMQKAVSDLTLTFATLKARVTTAAASAKQHTLDAAAQADARNANDKALILVKVLTESGAQSVGDIQGMAFTPRVGKPPPPPLVPPASIDVTPSKSAHGKVKVAAHEIGKTKRRYAAQSSPDPIAAASWVALPGAGKSRWIRGKSGTSVWVRFALMLGQQQSDWCTPVLVTLP